MIDTLIFSGGGPSGIAYSGVFQALLDQKVLDRDLTGIKEIVTTSVGLLFSYCILVKLNNRVSYEVVQKFDISAMINLDDLCVDDLLVDSGLFETTGIRDVLRSITRNVLYRDDCSLQELYDLTKIKLTVKVFNITKSALQFVSYETDPDMSIITLAQMTTAIPLFFKPIRYKGQMFCDGGFREGYPRGYCPSENYLGISIKGGCSGGDDADNIFSKIPLLQTMYALVTGSEKEYHTRDDPKIICIEVNLGLNFEISNETKKRVVEDAYKTTTEYLTTEYLTTGLTAS